MKKTLHFCLLIASVVSFFMLSGICYAVEPTLGTFSLDPVGQFYILDKTDFGTYPPYECYWHFYYGVYPATDFPIASGNIACQNISVPTDLEAYLPEYPTLFGNFWFL
ncbi:MAG: hypothetical protein MUP69_05660, partial [Candidatus Atribacteria bacterium]|nr:hypothetical protein [Candidatus Atribacteria bacterium]